MEISCCQSHCSLGDKVLHFGAGCGSQQGMPCIGLKPFQSWDVQNDDEESNIPTVPFYMWPGMSDVRPKTPCLKILNIHTLSAPRHLGPLHFALAPEPLVLHQPPADPPMLVLRLICTGWATKTPIIERRSSWLDSCSNKLYKLFRYVILVRQHCWLVGCLVFEHQQWEKKHYFNYRCGQWTIPKALSTSSTSSIFGINSGDHQALKTLSLKLSW